MVTEKGKIDGIIEAQIAPALIVRPRFLAESIWDVEHWRQGKLLSVTRDHNLCTDEGLNALLDIMFHGATQIDPWYIALFNTDTTILASHTYASPGYTESSDYTESNRQAYDEAAASSKSITNSASKASFTMNTTTTIYGAALVGGGTGADTKGDTAGGGTLYCASQFGSEKSVVNTDVLKVTVTITAADT